MSAYAAWLHFCCIIAKLLRGRTIRPHIEGLKREFRRVTRKSTKSPGTVTRLSLRLRK